MFICSRVKYSSTYPFFFYHPCISISFTFLYLLSSLRSLRSTYVCKLHIVWSGKESFCFLPIQVWFRKEKSGDGELQRRAEGTSLYGIYLLSKIYVSLFYFLFIYPSCFSFSADFYSSRRLSFLRQEGREINEHWTLNILYMPPFLTFTLKKRGAESAQLN